MMCFTKNKYVEIDFTPANMLFVIFPPIDASDFGNEERQHATQDHHRGWHCESRGTVLIQCEADHVRSQHRANPTEHHREINGHAAEMELNVEKS